MIPAKDGELSLAIQQKEEPELSPIVEYFKQGVLPLDETESSVMTLLVARHEGQHCLLKLWMPDVCHKKSGPPCEPPTPFLDTHTSGRTL